MKKFVTALISVLAVIGLVAPAAAAVFEEAYQGVQIPEGCYAIQAEVTDWLDMNPWGQVSPVGTTMIGQLCIKGDQASYFPQYFATVTCEEPPWSGSDMEQCEARISSASSLPERILPWNSSSYISLVYENTPEGTIARYEALTFDEETETATFITGVFTYSPPFFFEENDQYTRTTWTVTPVKLTAIFMPVRTGSDRIK